ncbi:MAG: arylsulfatase [Opitutaceae bacterium]
MPAAAANLTATTVSCVSHLHFRVGFVAALLFVSAAASAAAPRPNIIFLLADDLGYGDIGAYGQKKIRTPNLDQLARDGMRFTDHYSGHNVCAPARCVLMTGKHPGHAAIRDNRMIAGKGSEGQEPAPAGELQLPLTLKRLGYTVGGFGKWGLGPVGSTGDPRQQGFDRFFGYNCQAVAHNYYPTSLWSDDERVPLNNPPLPSNNAPFLPNQKLPPGADPTRPETYARFSGNDYAPDLIAGQARQFLRANRARPFFLYFPTTVPHLALQVPDDSLAEYAHAFPEEPYIGDRGYLPNRTPRAAYAGMITRLDREIGRLLALVDELGLRENTIVVFTSDNGPLSNRHGGTDADFFNSAGGLRGRKGSYYEGGFRVPCLVRWPGKIAAGTTSERVTGFEDWLPTFCELVNARDATPAGIDGISFAPTLLGKSQPPRKFLYRESPSYGGQQSVRVGRWKAIRTNLNPGPAVKERDPHPLALYDLLADPAEMHNVAAKHPDIVTQLTTILREQHTKSTLWPIRALDELPDVTATSGLKQTDR